MTALRADQPRSDAGATDPILSLSDVDVTFSTDGGEVHILRDVSLDVPRGGFVCIVGESGCGKSVTVHSVVQLLPDNGRIVDGRIVLSVDGETHELSSMDRYGRAIRGLRGGRIGMIFQDTMSSLNPAQKVGRQVAENLRLHEKMSKTEARTRVVAMFEQLGIPDPVRRYDAYPHEMSGGMRQRVMIAMAMICNPDLLIADEPTTALDVTIQAQIMELLKRLQAEEGKTVILITHNMGLVAEVADQVAVMYLGRIVEHGTRDQVLKDPRHPYTQALLESVPSMGMDPDTPLRTIAGQTPSPASVTDGCEFAGRCPHVRDRCRSGVIAFRDAGGGHVARCVLLDGEVSDDR
ncbi:ABC transporter ATP-binding protein [Mariniluteicoccus flavus]